MAAALFLNDELAHNVEISPIVNNVNNSTVATAYLNSPGIIIGAIVKLSWKYPSYCGPDQCQNITNVPCPCLTTSNSFLQFENCCYKTISHQMNCHNSDFLLE